MSYNWYILNVVSGQEHKVVEKIKSMIDSSLKGCVEEALVPCKLGIKMRRGQKVQENQKIFPGYVFVKTNLAGDTYRVLSTIPKVSGFLGKNNPKPVSDEKMKHIFSTMNNEGEDQTKDKAFEIGEVLNIIDGPFESFSGTVEEFDAEKQRVRIMVLIFGRATSVELDVSQVEKISK